MNINKMRIRKNLNSLVKLLGIIGMVSCSAAVTEEKQPDLTIVFDKQPDRQIPEWVETVSYLKLEDHDQGLLSRVDKMIARDGRLYIGDFSRHKVAVYKEDGSFSYAIDRQGKGPEEYLSISAFTVDDSALYVIDNFSRSMLMFDAVDGKYMGRKKMPLIAWDVETLDKGGFVFAFSPMQGSKPLAAQPPFRLIFTDSQLQVVKQMFPYAQDEWDPIGKRRFFSQTPEEVVFNWCITDEFVVIPKNQPDSVRTVKVDFGSRIVPPAGRKDYNLIANGYDYMYETPVVNGPYIAMEINFGENTDCFVYNVTEGKLAGNPADSAFNTMPFPACCDEQGRFLCVIQNKYIYDLYVADGFLRADAATEQHLEAGGWVVLLYTFRPVSS